MKKNKNQLTNYLRNILSSVVGEYHSHLYTEYNLINEDTEKRIDEHVELSHKPSSGDVIHCTDSIYQSEHFKFKVSLVELSSTGFTGNLYGTLVKTI